MPFGWDCEFPTWETCITANQDKSDPAAYCGALMRETEELCRNRSFAEGADRVGERLQLITAKEFKEQQRTAGRKKVGVVKGVTLDEVKRIDSGKDGITLSMTISTSDVDRDGDTIAVEGWDLKDYRKNPVVLFAHSHSDPPVGKSLMVWTEDDRLKSETRFTPHDLNPFGHMIGRLYEEGYMRAFSVGFLPLEWDEAVERSNDGPFFMPLDFKRQSLLEYSAVPVPANPSALLDAKAAGVVDLSPMVEWAERVLDEAGEGILVPRKTVEKIHGLLSKEKTIVLPATTPLDGTEKDEPSQTRVGTEEATEPGEEANHTGEAINDDPAPSGEANSEAPEEKSQGDTLPNLHRWKIVLRGNGRGSVEMDGAKLRGVRAVEIRGAVDEVPTVRLDVFAEEVEIESEAEEITPELDEKDSADEKGGPEPEDDDEVILELDEDEPINEEDDELDLDKDVIEDIIRKAVQEKLNRIRGRVD